MLSLPLIRNQRGIALLYMVILFTLLGVLVSVGARKLGALVTQGKISDTKVELERDVQMITAWGVKNGRLPTFVEYSTGVFGVKPRDAWGKPLLYTCDINLTAKATGGLCGRTVTTAQDVSFLLVSGGDDMNITSTPAITNGSLTGLLPDADLYRSMTLNELQSLAGCSGTTQGSLRIVNNELPAACREKSYSATLFGDGGVPPVSFTYAGLPTGISASGAALSGTTSVAKGTYPVVVTATDTAANSVKRSYILNIYSCPASP